VFIQYDMSTELSKNIYKNISMSGIHRETTRTPVLQFLDQIKWITRRVYHERRTILNFEDKNVSSFKTRVLNQLYHFKEA
jgi:hypothetical protein